MSNLVYINFINIDSQNFFNSQNSTILVSLSSETGYNKYSNEYYVKFDYIDNTTIKKYYIEFFDISLELLNTDNFTMEISFFSYVYGYYKDDIDKSLIIYNTNNFYQLIYLGLPNLKDQINIIVDYNYYVTESNKVLPQVFYNDSKSIMMLNNYQGLLNYIQNSIFLSGIIYKIYINSITSVIDIYNNNYKLFKINNNINLGLETRIYFNNIIKTFSNILYLNSYNFSDYKLFPENYESIITLIDYIYLPEDIFYKNTSSDKYFYKIDSNGNEEKFESFEYDQEIKYSVVLSLNLQTFNSVELENENENKYYNVLFFKNYINDNYFVNSITVFDYDYNKYFNDNVEYNNIINHSSDLYNKIINNDVNLIVPIIPQINYSYLLINLDLLNLINMIKFNCENNYFNNFMKSNKISVDTLIEYLSNFELKLCNIYKISNNNIKDSNINLNNLSYNLLSYNYNYSYNTSKNNINIEDYTNKPIINFNNNIINCIRCKIVFLFNQIGYYSLYGKIFLDNYNIQIYHKNYDITDLTEKKKLINLLIYLATVSLGIKIIFYNDIDSEPKVSSFFNYYLNTNPYYLFNEINLVRNLNNYDIYFDINSTNINYNQQYLKLNIKIKLDYYILFLYSDKNSILKDYNELVFSYSQYIFKIFKNTDKNGNIYENKDLFYIAFNNLKEINIFLEYLNTGLFITNISKLSNYFNIQKSVTFCNYYNINNYWVLDSLPEPQIANGNPDVLLKNKIFFSINNLHINQIYLQGELYIKETL